MTISIQVRGSAALAEAGIMLDGGALPATVTTDDGGLRVLADGRLTTGSHVIRAHIVGSDGHRQERLWRFAASDLDVRRIAGADRVATAEAAFPAGDAPAAVVARSDDFADALTAAALAAVLGGPLLLTSPRALQPDTRAALRRLVRAGADVRLLGGDDALSPQVAADVAEAGYEPVRIGGDSRYATAVAVAEEISRRRGPPARVVLASGEDFPDALAAAVPAAAAGWPLLLSTAEALPEATATWLRASDVERVEVIGGAAAIAPAVLDGPPPAVELRRTGGASRYDTAALVAQRFPSTDDAVVLTAGADYPEALAGAVLGARTGASLLLTGSRLPHATADAVVQRRPGTVTVLGGIAAVPHRAVEDLHRAAVDGAVSAVDMTPPAGAVTERTPRGEATATITLRLPGIALDDRTQVTVLVDGREAPTRASLQADTVTVALQSVPEGVPATGDVPLTVVAGLHGAASTAHVERDLLLRRVPAIATPEVFLARSGTGAVAGGAGTLRTYSLEVAPDTGVELVDFAWEAEAALSDPRGWTARGGWRLQRVEPGVAAARVVLARPATVDRYCARAGLRTAGIYSCWNVSSR